MNYNMSKKLTFLFIITFIITLIFFSGYFVIQQARGKVIGIGNDINAGGNPIGGIKNSEAVAAPEPITKGDMGCMQELCFTEDRAFRASQGKCTDSCKSEWCVSNLCQINDFEWCPGGGYDPPPDDPPVSCFTAQTPILMADGKYKSIKDVKQGDWVLTKENEGSDKMVSAKVVKTFEHTIDSYYRIINHKLEVTDTHPVFVDGIWKQAWTIKLGNKLLNEKGEEVMVESIKLKRAMTKVYNLEIEGYETYFANGFYVHNKPHYRL